MRPRRHSLELLERRRLLAGATFDISGVQPAALSQPQIHALFRTTASGAPLTEPASGAFDVHFDRLEPNGATFSARRARDNSEFLASMSAPT